MDSRPARFTQSITLLLVTVFTVFICFQANAASSIPEYNAVYYVEKLDNIVGRATFKLEHTDSGLHYSQRVELIGLAALFMKDKIEEDSWLKYRDEKLLLDKYQYLHKGTKDNNNVILNITWGPGSESMTGKAKGISKGQAIEFPVNAEIRDALSFQLSMMQDAGNGTKMFEYPVLSKGELKEYQFRKTKTENVQFNNQIFKAIRVERVHGNRLTRLWLAPDLHYIPIKVERLKDGEVDSRMILDKIHFSDKISSL